MPDDPTADPSEEASTDETPADETATDGSPTRDPDRDATTDGGPAGGAAVLDREVPEHLAERLSTVFDWEVRTYDDWLGAAAAAFGESDDRSVSAADLCHTDESEHVARVEGETHAFLCPLDAFVYPGFVEAPATVETASPAGTTLTMAVGPDGEVELLDADPEEAVVSVGAPADPGSTGCCAECSTGAVYEAVCPFVRAFPDRASYEAWAEGEASEAATTALPFGDAVALTRTLVDRAA